MNLDDLGLHFRPGRMVENHDEVDPDPDKDSVLQRPEETANECDQGRDQINPFKGKWHLKIGNDQPSKLEDMFCFLCLDSAVLHVLN